MNKQEIRNELNRLANKEFPKLHLDFVSDHKQDELRGYVRVMSKINFNNLEASIENDVDELAAKFLLRARVKDALINARDFIQTELDKVEKMIWMIL